MSADSGSNDSLSMEMEKNSTFASSYNQCITEPVFDSVDSQQMTISIVMKISSILSIVGSSYILFDILFKKKRTFVDAIYRILVGLSAYDLILSFFASFMNTWMLPCDSGWWGAAGNEKTCAMQGFMYSFAMVGIMGYMCTLSLYYLLKTKSVFEDFDKGFLRYVESWSHITIFVCGFIYAIPGVVTKANSPDCDWYSCVPQQYPEQKENLGLTMFPPIEETDPSYFYMVFFFGMVFITNVFAWTCLFTIICDVRKACKEERLNTNNNTRSEGEENDSDENDELRNNELQLNENIRLRNDFFFYIIAFHLSIMLPGQLYQLIFATGGQVPALGMFIVSLYNAAFVPLHGFFNMMAYERSRICKCYAKTFNKQVESNDSMNATEIEQKNSVTKTVEMYNVDEQMSD